MATVDEMIEAGYQAFLKNAEMTTSAKVLTAIDKGVTAEIRAGAMRRYHELMEAEKRASQESKLKTMFPALATANLSNFILEDDPNGTGVIIRSKT